MAKREFECKHCGHTVETWNGADVQCPECGQWYNAFGQALRDNWYDNPAWRDDEMDDMTGYEIEHANDW